MYIFFKCNLIPRAQKRIFKDNTVKNYYDNIDAINTWVHFEHFLSYYTILKMLLQSVIFQFQLKGYEFLT